MKEENQVPRRDFMKTAAILATATVVPAYMASCQPRKEFPAGKLNIALIGMSMGFNNMMKCAAAGENIVAFCDVDERPIENRMKQFLEKYPEAVEPYTFQDYKTMFKKVGDQIDAVIIATPDHTHTKITLEAMKLGKHVYTQKPLTHSVYESRILTRAAEKYDVATQMGNQGASNEATALVCESIWNNDIGEVKEVHAWTNRPIWPQALNRPEEDPENPIETPDKLDWDLWIGPAEMRPYNPMYHPWNWRGWWDFGTGALGDMACHILDVGMRSLRLGYPEGIEASTSKWTIESPSEAEKISYYFPARKKYKKVNMPEVKVTWYDGGLMPNRPDELPDGEIMGDRDGGIMFVGTKGKIICGCYARNPVFLPKENYENYNPVVNERIVEGGIDGHERDWVRACKEPAKSRVKTKSHFGYAGPFNEVVVMGTVATRLTGLKRVLKWDGENMKFTNIGADEIIGLPKVVKTVMKNGQPRFEKEFEEANALDYAKTLIRREPREGWELDV